MSSEDEFVLKFKMTFKNFIDFLNTIKKNDTVDQLIMNDNKNKLVYDKIINKLTEQFDKHKQEIKLSDKTMINNFQFLTSNIKIGEYWEAVDDEGKNKIWNFIVLFNLILGKINDKNRIFTHIEKKNANPYSIKDLASEMSLAIENKDLDAQKGGGDMKGDIMRLMKMVGVDKYMLKFLKDVPKDEIIKAISQCKEQIGDNTKNKDKINGLIDKIGNIIIKSSESESIDSLIDTMSEFSTDIKDIDKEMFTELIEKIKPILENSDIGKNGVIMNLLNVFTGGKESDIDPKKAMEQCQEVLKDSGINIDLSDPNKLQSNLINLLGTLKPVLENTEKKERKKKHKKEKAEKERDKEKTEKKDNEKRKKDKKKKD